MENGFDIEKHLVHPKKVDVSDLDFSVAPCYPLTESEIRCLSYIGCSNPRSVLTLFRPYNKSRKSLDSTVS